MRFQGKITNWNDAKGFGQIVWNGSSDRVRVHINDFTSRRRRPVNGDVVIYEAVKGTDGRFKAINVSYAGDEKKHASRPAPSGPTPMVVAAAFALGLLGAIAVGRSPWWLGAGYLAMSLITFAAYFMDKLAAQRGTWRTPENTLHVMALLGGWPGAALAQRLFRHKTMKQPFRGVYNATIVINIAAFVWLVSTHEGRELLRIFLEY